MALSRSLLVDLCCLMSAEQGAIHDPYAWPPVAFDSLPDEARREHARFGAIRASLGKRIDRLDYEHQEDCRATGALYPSADEALEYQFAARVRAAE